MSGTCFENADRVYLGYPFLGISEESKLTVENYKEAYSHFYAPLSRYNFQSEFYNLLVNWRNEVRHSSFVAEIAMNPNYQKIIGMGEKVVPLLLQELERRPEHLFWALKAITGADPVQPHQRGKVRDMAQAWLLWASEKGYVW